MKKLIQVTTAAIFLHK